MVGQVPHPFTRGYTGPNRSWQRSNHPFYVVHRGPASTGFCRTQGAPSHEAVLLLLTDGERPLPPPSAPPPPSVDGFDDCYAPSFAHPLPQAPPVYCQEVQGGNASPGTSVRQFVLDASAPFPSVIDAADLTYISSYTGLVATPFVLQARRRAPVQQVHRQEESEDLSALLFLSAQVTEDAAVGLGHTAAVQVAIGREAPPSAIADLLAEVSRCQDSMQEDFLKVSKQIDEATKEMAAAVGSSRGDTRSYFPSFDRRKQDEFLEYWDKLKLTMSTEKWQPLVGRVLTTPLNAKLSREL